jgi:hypothetical protein
MNNELIEYNKMNETCPEEENKKSGMSNSP